MSDSYNLSFLGINTCFWCEPKNESPTVGNSWDSQSNHIGLTWPKPSQHLVSCLSCSGESILTWIRTSWSLGELLQPFNAEGLVRFPGDSCFAFNNLRKREKGGKGQGERTKGRKKERKYRGKKWKNMLIPLFHEREFWCLWLWDVIHSYYKDEGPYLTIGSQSLHYSHCTFNFWKEQVWY